ncbi:replicative DNA helicase [Gammaproteobacteria bacterium]
MRESIDYVPEGFDAATEALRIPPHSQEAEQSVLGGLMLDNAAWDQVADLLVEDDFYRRDHRLIFRSIASLADKGNPFDVVTLSEWLEARGELSNAGGLAYLATLARDTPSAANIVAYANIVRERSVMRSLIRVGTDISGSAYNPEGRDSVQLLDFAEQRVFEIAERGARTRRGFQSIRDLSLKVIDRIDILYNQENPITGIPTGYYDLDEMTSGLQPSDLVIIAGRPSMGKTSFAMNIAEHAAIKERKSVAVFSMEMPGEQLAMRLISSLGRIDQHRLRTGKLLDDDWPRLTSAIGLLGDIAMFIDDTPALTPTELRARCRRLKRERGLDLVLIDYLQLMQVSGNKENRATEISEISRGLKALAKELRIPVVALSQLNRSLEQRPNKRPIMSDLRESGAIEQDADVIVFIYRDEVYDEQSTDKGVAEIIISKQRNGPIGTVRLTFLGQYTRFENFKPEVHLISSKPDSAASPPRSEPLASLPKPDTAASPPRFDPLTGPPRFDSLAGPQKFNPTSNF